MLSLDFKICEDKSRKEILFNEWTKSYNSLNNPVGWGLPNPATTDATSATLSVLFPGTTTPEVFTFTSGFPTTDTSVDQRILNTDLGLATAATFEDGIYTFTYTVNVTVSGIPIAYTKSYDVYFYGAVRCCIDKMKARINDSGCSCDSDFVNNVLWVQGLFYGLEYAALCNKKDVFDNLLTYLEKLCALSPCDCP